MFRRTALICALGLLTSACSPSEAETSPDQYEGAPRQIIDKLVAADTLEFKLARHCGILVHLRPMRPNATSARWQVISSGKEMFYFDITATPVSDKRSRVDIAVGPKEANGGEAYDGTQRYPWPALQQPIRPAIREFINSVMRNRPYDRGELGFKDKTCAVQANGLESGLVFSIHDDPKVRSIRAQ
jgi:hypothetical protein